MGDGHRPPGSVDPPSQFDERSPVTDDGSALRAQADRRKPTPAPAGADDAGGRPCRQCGGGSRGAWPASGRSVGRSASQGNLLSAVGRWARPGEKMGEAPGPSGRRRPGPPVASPATGHGRVDGTRPRHRFSPRQRRAAANGKLRAGDPGWGPRSHARRLLTPKHLLTRGDAVIHRPFAGPGRRCWLPDTVGRRPPRCLGTTRSRSARLRRPAPNRFPLGTGLVHGLFPQVGWFSVDVE